MGRNILPFQKDKVLRTLDGNQQTGELATDLGVPLVDKLTLLVFSLSSVDL